MSNTNIKDWRTFARLYRFKGRKLLQELEKFDDAILVTGVQRSGTTILTRIIIESGALVDFREGGDDELEAALILSGETGYAREGRHCFQTTYLNEAYREYLDHKGNYTMIWVVRNPYSVVYSMVHNWRRYTLDNLFRGTGVNLLEGNDKRLYGLLGPVALTAIKKACLSYVGKTQQLFELYDELGPQRLHVVDYDALVNDPGAILSALFEKLEIPYGDECESRLHGSSVRKMNKLSKREMDHINRTCVDAYKLALDLVPDEFAGSAGST